MFLILGPALNLLAGFFWQNDTQGSTAGTIIVLSTACWLIGLIGLFERLRPSTPRYVAVGLPVTVFGAIGGVAYGVQSIHEGLFAVSHADAVERLGEHPFAAFAVYWTCGPLFPISLFVLGLVLARTRVAPLPVGIMVSLGAVVFPLSRITREASIAHLADLFLLLPFLYLGLRSMSQSQGVPGPRRHRDAVDS
ncbi:hypothetical protein AB0B57_21220 [Micromonospora sp. NPDC049101]|uniref:hypothetical protein n=1 Tax=Micromonospora sp. NPDC049101 TaxID=3155032 RepID=UPI0033D4BA36